MNIKKEIIKLSGLNEEFVDAKEFKSPYKKNKVYMEIYKNPTLKELRDSGRPGFGSTPGIRARGIVLKNGDLYITSPQEDFIHEEIVIFFSEKGVISNTYAGNWWWNIKSLEEFICVSRYKNGQWAPAESYNLLKPNEKHLVEEKYGEILKRLKP